VTALDVVGVGLAALDTFRVVERYPAPDTKCRTVDALVTGGGPVATALVTVSRLGGRCAFLGCLGDDPAGRAVTGGLAREGVDVSGVRHRPECTTPQPVIVVERSTGRRTVFEWHEGCGPIRPEDLDGGILSRARSLLCDARNPEAERAAAERVRAGGGLVMIDCGHPRPGLEELARVADVLIVSHSFLEARWGPGATLERGLEELASWGPAVVGFTLGEAGSAVRWRGEVLRTSAFPLEVVDTTGAGDVFHGAFLWGMLRGWAPGMVMRFASAAAALSCRALGGRGAIPTEEEATRLAGDSGA
jgi:sulfofructose kinase